MTTMARLIGHSMEQFSEWEDRGQEAPDYDESDEDEENVEIDNIMDSSHNLDSHYSDTQSNSTTSTATALHLNPNNSNSNAGEGGGGGGGGLAPPRNMANRRTSLADIISRVRRTSAGLQANHPLQPLTESKSELPHYSIPGEKFADKRVKRHSIHGMMEEEGGQRPHQEMESLSLDEKKFLLAVERGDVASSRRMLQKAQETDYIDINCIDPLGRSALLMAIDNENLEMVELLINHNVDTKDALLHAISEEFVEAVEVLLDHEDAKNQTGGKHSWESLSPDTATFTPDITPLILAAHRDNYEIIKIMLDRGWVLPMPHDVRCGCDECVTSRGDDSLRHSRSRINAYRALASPSLIALSSKDPILTAFELSWELRRLSFLEHEFKNEYQELRKQCQEFATALLDHTRTSHELGVLLNHDPTGPVFEQGGRMNLNRLKLAIKLRQKKFVAHPNVQQLLASIWYEGLPGFRRKNMALQALEIIRIGMLFPLFSIAYIIAPHSTFGMTMRKPFIKFICHSASYFTFLFLLMLASQRIETVMGGWFWESTDEPADDMPTKRGSTPTFVEWLILGWVSGLIWSEVKQLWDVGLQEYVHDMWNVIDFVTNSLYVATVALRIVSYFQVREEMVRDRLAADLPREKWDAWDPMLISEGLFSAANIFSSLKLVYIFSVNPHLGPLQVSLSRMVMDIMKFFFLYVLVLFAFSSGLNQLLWYYADMEKKRCHMPEKGDMMLQPNGTVDPNACAVWRRFANLFETTQTLFWAVFGLVDLDSFDLDGIKIFTRFWGMLMFGTYSVINIVVLLNLLIAMMNHSYQLISERADVEWKFARSRLWISYFEEGGTSPPPFNVIPSPKSFIYAFQWLKRKFCGHSRSMKKEHMRTMRQKAKQASQRDFVYQTIMRNLVRRYVTVEQRKAESQGVTEDDVNEIKQDISAFRCELVEILKNSGMNTETASGVGSGSGGKKNRQKERRLMKGFNIAVPQHNSQLPPVAEFSSGLPHQHSEPHPPHGYDVFGSTMSGLFGPGITQKKSLHGNMHQFSSSQSSFGDTQTNSISMFGKLAPKFHGKRLGSHKTSSGSKWGTLIKAGSVSRFMGRSRSEDSVCNAPQNGQMESVSQSNSPVSEDAITESPTDSNPSLDRPDIEASKTHHSGHFHFGALAALKRRRKKFSNSRHASPVQQEATANIQTERKLSSTSRAMLQRASSVPARASLGIVTVQGDESAVSQAQQRHQHSAEKQLLDQQSTLTSSTTEESVNGQGQGAAATVEVPHISIPMYHHQQQQQQEQPILSGTIELLKPSLQTPQITTSQPVPNLPNVIPVRGHLHQQGWL